MISWNGRKLKGKDCRTPPTALHTPPNTTKTPKTPLDTPKLPQAPETYFPVPQEQPWLLPSTHQTVWGPFELSRDVRRGSGRNEGVRRFLLSVRNVLAMFWICQEWYESVWGILRVSGGCLEGVGGCRRGEGGIWYSFPFNFLRSQMKSLTFCNRPGGPKCLK